MPGGTFYNDTLHEGHADAGVFIVSLCELAAPVSIRPPQSPHLKPFTFFVGHTDLPEGGQQLSLNMGYFKTLAAAQECVQCVRGRYPNATALPALAGPREQAAAAAHEQPSESLSDTQVMHILATRAVDPYPSEIRDESSAKIPLIRPEDTSTRLALKAAVSVGAPVSFAVQLQWSEQPIDLSRVSSLALFKGHTTYVTQRSREGRARYFLRLGFFADPVSANELASVARAKFTSAAVVPVTEEEIMRARDPDSQTIAAATVTQAPDNDRKPRVATSRKVPGNGSRSARPGKETLNESLEHLAEREVWADPDSISESGVRHLKVVVQGRNSRN